MRKIDAEPIRAALAARKNRERVAALQFRRIEQWRDRLLAEGSGLVEVLKTDTGIDFDTAALARLVDRAQAERSRNQPPHASRELFRVLREILGDQ